MFAMLISCKFLFKVMIASLSFSYKLVSKRIVQCRLRMLPYYVDNDTREQEALLVLVRAFLNGVNNVSIHR